MFIPDEIGAASTRERTEQVVEDVDMDLEDSDFEPGADRELLGLFFPEVSIGKMSCCVKHYVIQSTRNDCDWRGDWVSGLTVHCFKIQKVSHQVIIFAQ